MLYLYKNICHSTCLILIKAASSKNESLYMGFIVALKVYAQFDDT